MFENIGNGNTLYICILVVFCFGVIHFLEFSSFLSRIAGIITNSKVTSYTVQQSTFVITRFFFVAMMPLIGLIVDLKVSRGDYILMIHASILFAALSYVLVLLNGNTIIRYFCNVITNYKSNGTLMKSLLSLESYEKKSGDYLETLKKTIYYIKTDKEGAKLLLGSAFVFCCYSLGVFISFYIALNFYDYRSSIGQLSGLVNAFATVLLTFYIEPKISIAIDNDELLAKEKVLSLLLGRFLGVCVLAQLFAGLLWFL